MRVSAWHRSENGWHTPAEYEELATAIVKRLSLISSIDSIITCGSLEKGDVIQGWSDLDLIVLTTSSPSPGEVQEIGHAIASSKALLHCSIGVGLDIGSMGDLNRFYRIAGRPLMMTFEVARYGRLRHGLDRLAKIRTLPIPLREIDYERHILIGAEKHSWIRDYASRSNSDRVSWLFTCTKALLRILQCEIGPNMQERINTQTALIQFQESYPGHSHIHSLTAAVNVRSCWGHFARQASSSELESQIEDLQEAILSYPLRYSIQT